MSVVQFPRLSARTISSRPSVRLLLIVIALCACASIASAQCTPNPTNNTLTICTPLNNQTVSSPFTVSAVATSSASVTKFLVYLDSVLKFQQLNTKSISTSLTAAAGSHNLTVQYYNGAWIKATNFITVGSASGITVTVSPSSATVATGGTQQFTAAITGTSNTAVTWAVDGMFGGNTTVGTISTSGLYTAPSATGTHTITATSAADSSKTGAAGVTVVSSGGSCNAPSSPGAILCTPAAGSTVSSPVQFSGAGTGASGSVNHLELWIDGTKIGDFPGNKMTASVPLANGSHAATLIEVDSSSNFLKSTPVTFTVGSGGGGSCAVPSSPGAILCTPTAGSTVSSPVPFTGAGTGASGSVNHLELWVDGTKIGNYSGSTMTASVPLANGSHTATLVEVDSSSNFLKSTPITFTVSGGGGGGTGTVAVTTYHNDLTRQGANTAETTLTTSNVNSGSFGKLATYSVDGQVYPQPLIVPALGINGGTHNVLYVATEHDSVYAFDADGGGTLWSKSLLGPGMTSAPSSDNLGVSPEIGVLSTPVIDRSGGTIYLVAEVSNGGKIQFWLHALSITTGAEKFGGPKQVTATVSGTGADSSGGKITLEGGCYQRSGLALANGNVYISFGHCGHGWVFSYNASTLAQSAVLNDSPNGTGGDVWMGGGAPAVDSSGNLFVETGVNADNTIGNSFSNAYLKLSPALTILDYFIPSNTAVLTKNDADLGSGAPIILPDNSSSHPHELVGAGKDGRIFVINRDNMGKFSSTANNVVQIVQSGVRQYDNFYDTPAFWNGNIYYHAAGDVLRQFRWSNGLLSTSPIAVGTVVYGSHGATPAVSSNGGSNGIVWDLQLDGQPNNPAILHAYDASNVGTELYSSNENASRDSAGPAVKFTAPTIANGKVYVPAGHQVNIYGLLK